MPISAFVVSYNRENIIEACLRSLRFADELIVLDKGSTDKTVQIAETIADKIYPIPWSPTVEETRAEALSLCTHENVVFLDDDECLSAGAADFFIAEEKTGFLDGYFIPCRQFILGRHSSTAYYWPERQLKAFRKGSVEFLTTVHSGVSFIGKTTSEPHYDSDIHYSNLSHTNTSQWLEKANRYTSEIDRTTFFSDDGIRSFHDQMKDRLHYWMVERTPSHDEYDQVVAALRTVYDIVDFVKAWETKNGLDGDAEFKKICRSIIESHTGI